MSLPEPFVAELSARLGSDALSVDALDLAEYGRDWTRVYEPAPSGLVRPRSTAEVSALLELCARYRVAVVPSGGRTGLAGGAVAAQGELVLSLERMRELRPVDTAGRTVRAQAGAVTEAVHRHTQPFGLTWPVDFASKGSSTVGGNIATNAGGVRVVRYGTTRRWVLGVEVVLASGRILELGGSLEKDNTGLSLKELFVGSEGILGVITAATLKLSPLPADARVLLLALPSMDAVLDVFAGTNEGPFVLSAYEFFSDRCLERVMRHRRLPAPLAVRSPFYALLEVEPRSNGALDDWMAKLIERGPTLDGALSANEAQLRSLWQYREGISESLAATGMPHKQDVSVPIARLGAFTHDLERTLMNRYPDHEICLFGHIGDGNVHVNLMKPDAMTRDEFLASTATADHALFHLVRSHGGSISAEHGIGLLKKAYVPYTRTPDQIDLMRAIKRVFDPEGLMNPGKVID
jgi:FAD/FMN-containing dehydrogenase